MKKMLLCIGLLLVYLFSLAQYKVSFVVNKLPAYHKASNKIYLVGNFNNWNPHDEKLQLKNINGRPGITIELSRGMYEYKFTEGSWETAESLEEGATSPNRKLVIDSDTSINVEIQNWADHFPKKERISTATKNVHIVDNSFYIPQLDRHRRVWIYLPENYSSLKKKYPVLYMQDGQNVFDDATSTYGEWGVDEALDSLGKQ